MFRSLTMIITCTRREELVLRRVQCLQGQCRHPCRLGQAVHPPAETMDTRPSALGMSDPGVEPLEILGIPEFISFLKFFEGMKGTGTRDGHADAERLPIRKMRRYEIRHMSDISNICRIYPTYPNRCASPKISAWPSLAKMT